MAVGKRKELVSSESRPAKKPRSEDDNKSAPKEQAAFPRGGASALTPLEKKQIHIQAKQDVLFEQTTGKKIWREEFDVGNDHSDDNDEIDEADLSTKPVPKSSKKSKKPTAKGTKSKAIEELETVKIESLGYRRMSPGVIVIGQVSEINAQDIALSLPNNLTGYISITSISDTLTQRLERAANLEESDEDVDSDEESEDKAIDLAAMFSIGQFLRAQVLSTDTDSKGASSGKKHISLSIKPTQANKGLRLEDLVENTMAQASVVSVEDHGIVLDVGLEEGSVRGFIGTKDLGLHKPDDLQPGFVMLCLVTGQSSNGKIVKLSVDRIKIGNYKRHTLSTAPSIDVLLPGTSVEVLISQVTEYGVSGKVLGLIDVTADFIHSGMATDAKAKDKLAPGNKMKARIICTFPHSEPRKVGVSVLGHILQWQQSLGRADKKLKNIVPLEKFPLSAIIEKAKVITIDPRSGVILDTGLKEVAAFAHISRLTDDRLDNFSNKSDFFAIGTDHKARVLGYNYMDGMFIVSLQPKVISQSYVRYEDVKLGDVVKGAIVKVLVSATGVSGLIVEIARDITGLVPEAHISDIHLEHPERKFKEGLQVTARVLSIEAQSRKMRLTLKKALVNSDSAIWTDYEKLEVGMKSPGTIVSLSPKGAVLQFFSSIRGFLPLAEMSEAFIEDPKDHFRIGQTVNVHVLQIDAASERLTLTCKNPSMQDPQRTEAFQSLKLGSKVDGVVSGKTNESIVLDIAPSDVKGILSVNHLLDGSLAKANSALQRMRIGQSLSGLLVLDKLENKKLVQLSNKPSLLNSLEQGKCPQSLSELKPGIEIVGYVKNITSSGIFVQFLADLTGLLPKDLISEELSQLSDFGQRIGQTITATVSSVDMAQYRFTLTQKPLINTTGKTAVVDFSNPVDPACHTIHDLTFGRIVTVRIKSIKETQLNVQLADNVPGRIDVSSIYDSIDEIKNRKRPLETFKPQQEIRARLVGMYDSRNHRFLPLSHRSKAPVYELSAKPSDLESDTLDLLTLDKVKKGSSWLVFVNNVSDGCLWVNLSPNVRGRIRAADLSSDTAVATDLNKSHPIGSALFVTVVKVDVENSRLDLTANSASTSAPMSLKDFSVGQVLLGRITKVTERQLMVQLSDEVSAPVRLVDLADDYSKATPWTFSKNQMIRVCIKAIDLPNKKLVLSARPSLVLNSALPVEDPDLRSATELKVNDIRRGFVTNIADKGLFIALSSSLTGFVRVTNLADEFLKDWKSAFQLDELVQGKIIAVDESSGHIQMSLKKSHLTQDYVQPISFNDVRQGQIVSGKIRKIADFGVFIVIDNSSNVSGLCHRSKMSDRPDVNPRKLFEEGDSVKAKILTVNVEKRQVSFGMQASELGADLEAEAELDAIMGSDSEQGSSGKDAGISLPDLEEDEEDEMEVSLKEDQASMLPPRTEDCGLTIEGSDWRSGAMHFDDDDLLNGSDDEDVGTATSTQKTRKKGEIQIDRTGDLDANGPQSSADFERLLLGQPNNSVLWLSYMAYFLQSKQVVEARELGERALRSIHINEQGEKFNIWIALLNLENTYGNDESLQAVLARAIQYCDAQDIYERLISIYIQCQKHQKADELFESSIKKFTQSPSLYLNYATFLMTTIDEPDRARALLPRAMQALPPHTHLNLTSKFAQMEFTSPNGEAERGRTIFETLVSQWPKRLDLWHILLDSEIKVGDEEVIRPLFERVTVGLHLKARKTESFFKKWLEWETKCGDRKSVDRVRRLMEAARVAKS